jgi:hypothetical protein
MKYYHVNQGIHSREMGLSLQARSPEDAARAFFKMLATSDVLIIWPMTNERDAHASLRIKKSEWIDLLWLGCLVEDREASRIWSVKINSIGVLHATEKSKQKPKLMVIERKSAAKRKTKAKKAGIK